ncbi:hypothetical protein FJY93_02455 [Candidatus Kaiserbacteria bacterium]|nr:hypothetical protein [Candidatus Kaiserbacteria bacterium]
MSGFSLTSSRERPIAVVDIESGVVSVAIAIPHTAQPLEIIAVGQSELPLETRSPTATIAALAEQIDEACKKALDSYHATTQSSAKIARVLIVINAPWARSQTIRSTKKFTQETPITEDMIADLAKQALDQSTEIDIPNLLEANVVHIELNGYATAEPVGKSAHTLSVYALISGCDPHIRSIVEETLQKRFASATLIFRSQLRTVLSVTEALPAAPKDFCLIDIGREASIIANIHTDLSVAHHTVSEGMLSIVRRIAGKGIPEETLSLLRMSLEGTCSSAACAAITEAMIKAEPELVRIYADAMVKLVADRYVPPVLVLLCDDLLFHWLSELFSRIDFTQFTTTTRPFSIIPLHDAASFKSFVTTPKDVHINQRLMFACALAHLEEKS